MAYTAIDDPEAYFQVELYTGTGSELSTTFDGDTDMQPDFVWIKDRGDASSSALFDSVRGVQKRLKSDSIAVELTQSDSLTAFGSDGFTSGGNGHTDEDGNNFVAWCWKESATSGFDIVSYTGNESARTISHSLSAVPEMMIVRGRIANRNWVVYHHTQGNTYSGYMDANDAFTDQTHWNDTSPTSSVFTIEGGSDSNVNTDSAAYIAYLWRGVQGFSKIGKYTGNGNADGTFIYTGFRPAMIFVKQSSGSNSWHIMDNKRDTFNPLGELLIPNSDAATNTVSDNRFDLLSNGFKCRDTAGGTNASGETYVYMAFAEQPFVNSEGVPCNAR